MKKQVQYAVSIETPAGVFRHVVLTDSARRARRAFRSRGKVIQCLRRVYQIMPGPGGSFYTLDPVTRALMGKGY